ncbi:hypothetical protein [Roseinatronobacter monicus]|uniref:Uncharacterized protein n=1 Tax=Roseinatronobacter monicus TaxID=393481 RepID=A0A543KIL9_9RHOB|nr:hypothetical protein [Roseinatronobacter monicus]TQM94897.1 hypothetical protein BD293_3588 [Roseinatronobacter monicus]
MNKAPLIQQRIPVTSPALYLSGIQALNLRENGIDDPTGDWHFVNAFFTYADQPQDVPLYGAGGAWIDTHESLGARGIRDLSAIVCKQELVAPEGPVWVANFYRAIADIVALDARAQRSPGMASVSTINQWLDTPEEIAHLKQDYLTPLAAQFQGDSAAWMARFLEEVRYR